MDMTPQDLIAQLGLTDEAKQERRKTIGGSDANVLMSGDEAAILRLWEVKTARADDEDLSNVLPVVMGQWTEALNCYWYERQTNRKVTHHGAVKAHPDRPFMACTLDGLTFTEAQAPAIFEAKHVNAWSKIEEVEQKYMPQLHHNMAVCGMHHAVLSVFLGTLKWEYVEVERDDWYLAELMDREKAFWSAVEQDEHPPFLAPVEPPKPVSEMRTVDLTGNNEWAAFAADWLENRDAAKAFEKAAKGIKGLVESDVSLAYGHGVQCKRSKAGALTISEVKE